MTSGRQRNRYALRRLGGAIVLAAAAVVVLDAAAPAQHGTGLASAPPAPGVVAAGVTVGGVDLSGLTAPEARKALRAHAARPVVLVFRGESWRFTPRTLGARPDTAAAVKTALGAPAAAAYPLHVTVDQKRLKRWARDFAATFDRKARDSRVVLRGLRPRATRSSFGRKVQRSWLRTAVTSELRAGDRGPLQLPVEILRPDVVRAEIGPAIVIRRASNRLTLYKGAGRKGMRVVRKFDVATGLASNPTPLGSFTIVDKQRDPWWYPPDSDWAAGREPVPPGPGNPLGTRWMGLDEPLIGIHGTPDAASIGYSASRGCIRMLVPDAEWLFERVPEGTQVFVVDA